MRKLVLGMLLASVAVPAFAADMPLKAAPAAVPYADWSGVYLGVAAGRAWGREKLSKDISSFDNATASSQLFGTSAARFFSAGNPAFPTSGTPVLIQPPFDLGTCLIPNCNKVKMSGIM